VCARAPAVSEKQALSVCVCGECHVWCWPAKARRKDRERARRAGGPTAPESSEARGGASVPDAFKRETKRALSLALENKEREPAMWAGKQRNKGDSV